jgi:DNA-binding beta-propeller fold protein YncE
MKLGLALALWVFVAVGLIQLAFAAPPKKTVRRAMSAPSSTDGSYHVDTGWPAPLPDKWLLGDVGGVSVDRHDHIWVLNRPRTLRPVDIQAGANPPTAKCCVAAPPVIEFDGAGKVLRSWGGPKQVPDWFDSEHGIFVDADDHVWILGAGPHDGQLLKFDMDGRLLLRIGRKGTLAAPNDPTMLGLPTDIYVDTARREVYVSDGYRNHRVIVFDSESGTFKRQWTAFGRPVDPTYSSDPGTPEISQQGHIPDKFTTVHCVTMIAGEIYVCDRANDRVQVFTPDGRYLRQISFNANMAGSIGAAWDAAPIPGNTDRILVLDGINSEFAVLDTHSGNVLASYLSKGRYAGQMSWPHQVAIDRKGRLYVAEVGNAQRIQRFVP